MSSQAPPLLGSPNVTDRSRLVRRAKALSLLTIAWMTVEAGVAISAAVIAGSVALLGFGLDSLIELASASTILWLYTRRLGDSDDCGKYDGELHGERDQRGATEQIPMVPG